MIKTRVFSIRQDAKKAAIFRPLRALLVQDLRDTLGTMHDNLCLFETLLDWAAGFEDLGEFFESAPAGFDIEEVDESELEHVPEDEEEIILESS
jgi:hypothetical protein